MRRLARARAQELVERKSVDDANLKIKYMALRISMGQEIATSEVSRAADHVAGLRLSDPGQNVWLTIGDKRLTSLVVLFGMALRKSCSLANSSAYDREEWRRLRSALGVQLWTLTMVDGSSPSFTTRAIAPAFVRSHACRCYAVLLSEASRQLQQQRPRRPAHGTVQLLSEITSFIAVVARAAEASDELMTMFESELRASALLEHWARLVLLLGCWDEGVEEVRLSLRNTTTALSTRPWTDLSVLAGPHMPCMSYLLSSHVVRLAAALDGGPTYGMPQQHGRGDEERGMTAGAGTGLAAAAPLFSKDGRPADGQVVDTALAQFALGLWGAYIRVGWQDLRADYFTAKIAHLEQTTAAGSGPGCSRAAAPADAACAGGGPAAAAAAAADAAAGFTGGDTGRPASSSGPERWPWRMRRWRLQVRPCALATQMTQRSSVEALGGAHDAAAVPGGGAVTATALAVPPQLQRWVHHCDSPPFHLHATLELSLRLAAAAVAAMPPQPGGGDSLPAPTRPQSGASAGAGGGGAWLTVSGEQACSLALQALRCADAAVAEAAVSTAPLRGWERARLEALWRLKLEAVERARGVAAGGDGHGLSGDAWHWERMAALAVALRGRPHSTGLPPAPSPDVSAALSAGWVGRVERLLCPSDDDSHRPFGLEAQATWEPHTLWREEAAWGAAWGEVLAFGPRREVLSLLATAAKRMHDSMHTASCCDKYSAYGNEVLAVELVVATEPLQVLLSMAREQVGGGGGAGALPSSSSAAAKGVAACGEADSSPGTTVAAAVAAAACADAHGATGSGGSSSSSASSSGGGAGGTGSSRDASYQLRLMLSYIALRIVPQCYTAVGGIVPRPLRARNVAVVTELLGWLPLLAAVYGHTGWGAKWLHHEDLALPLAAALAHADAADLQAQLRLVRSLRAALRALLRLLPALAPSIIDMAEKLATSLEARPSKPGPSGLEGGVASGDVGSNGAAAASSGGAGPPPPLPLLRRLLGPGGPDPDPDTELLAELEAACTEARQARAAHEKGSNGSGTEDEVPPAARGAVHDVGALPDDLRKWVAAASLLLPEEAFAEAPQGCANVVCINLEGDSEVTLPLPCAVASGGALAERRFCGEDCRQQVLGRERA